MKTIIFLALVAIAAAQRQPPQHFPQPQPPRQPVQPRQSWRDGFPDARCNVPDDHNGPAQIISGTNGWDFFICWGGIGWPFMCAPGSVYNLQANQCLHPGQTIEPPRFRPFNDDEEDNE